MTSTERKMREIIRFAWGKNSLGDFMVAMSGKGLVTLEFGSNHTATEDALRVRFPEAELLDSQQGLADLVEQVNRAIEEPGFDPQISLDLRGTPMKSKFGRCCAHCRSAKPRATAPWRPDWAPATPVR
jgi:AraC family transcriptional regulator of adaptative response/methylated-DNA-[protein]-cysteine methyltransferase